MQPSENDFKLARVFLNHSLSMKPKEKLLITTSDLVHTPLVKAVYIEAMKMGVFPIIDSEIDFYIGRNLNYGYAYQFFSLANEWQLKYLPNEILKAKTDWADAYVRIVTIHNSKELSQIDTAKVTARSKLARPFFDKMIDSDRWILTYYPTEGWAQEAGVSYDWLLDFYFKSCLVDYKKMERELLKIEKVLDKGKTVRIVGKDTDLSFSIEGRLAKACYGERNIPDGEVFLAPVKQTVEGKVYFDFPTEYAGADMEGIYLEFKKGKVVTAKAQRGQDSLEKILNTDSLSRFLGELGIGANYNIQQAMRNTLFDEKIGGTIHMALGFAYHEKRGGIPDPKQQNNSAIHWDIVKNMKLKGSQLLIDGKPLMKEGTFLV